MSLPITAMDKLGVIESVRDYAKNPSTNAAVVPVLDIPAGTYVLFAGAEVIEAEGGTAAGTLGDGDGATGYLATLNANSTGYYTRGLTLTEGAPNTVTGYSAGKFYAAADTIDHVTTNGLDAAVIRYFAVVANLAGN